MTGDAAKIKLEEKVPCWHALFAGRTFLIHADFVILESETYNFIRMGHPGSGVVAAFPAKETAYICIKEGKDRAEKKEPRDTVPESLRSAARFSMTPEDLTAQLELLHAHAQIKGDWSVATSKEAIRAAVERFLDGLLGGGSRE